MREEQLQTKSPSSFCVPRFLTNLTATFCRNKRQVQDRQIQDTCDLHRHGTHERIIVKNIFSNTIHEGIAVFSFVFTLVTRGRIFDVGVKI